MGRIGSGWLPFLSGVDSPVPLPAKMKGMAQHTDPTIQDVLERIDGLANLMKREVDRLGRRLDGLDKKVDDLAEVVQATAAGQAKRFDAIENRLGDPTPVLGNRRA